MNQTTPGTAHNDLLENRVAEERLSAVMQAGPGCGVATPAQVAGKTGLELLQAMRRGELPCPPIAKTLDFTLVKVGPGSAAFQGTSKFAHYNPLGSVHGSGFALLDSALGCAVPTIVPPGRD